MKSVSSLRELLVTELRDLRSAEGQLVQFLPRMANAARSDELSGHFDAHRRESEEHLRRINQILASLGENGPDVVCHTISALIDEATELIETKEIAPEILDAGLIGVAQRMEHYEMAVYGTARSHALELDLDAVADRLQMTLDEESSFDFSLSDLAEDGLNARALARSEIDRARERSGALDGVALDGAANGDRRRAGYTNGGSGRPSPTNGGSAMHLSEVMTRDVESIRPDTNLKDAALIMRNLDVGVVPVTDGDRLLGLLTDRDIVVRAVSEGRDPRKTQAHEVMTRELACCYEDEEIGEASLVMATRQIRRLPIVDHGDHLVGIVSLGDLAVATDDPARTGRVLERVSEPGRPAL